jgi:hypothetical protein
MTLQPDPHPSFLDLMLQLYLLKLGSCKFNIIINIKNIIICMNNIANIIIIFIIFIFIGNASFFIFIIMNTVNIIIDKFKKIY